MYFMSFLVFCGDMLRFLSVSMEGLWIAPCTPIVMVTRGLTIQPFVLRVEGVDYIFTDFLPICGIGGCIMVLCEINELDSI